MEKGRDHAAPMPAPSRSLQGGIGWVQGIPGLQNGTRFTSALHYGTKEQHMPPTPSRIYCGQASLPCFSGIMHMYTCTMCRRPGAPRLGGWKDASRASACLARLSLRRWHHETWVPYLTILDERGNRRSKKKPEDLAYARAECGTKLFFYQSVNQSLMDSHEHDAPPRNHAKRHPHFTTWVVHRSIPMPRSARASTSTLAGRHRRATCSGLVHHHENKKSL